MEFEELQKIWMAESQENVYVINEKALHNRIIAKKKKALRISNFSERLLIIVNTGTGFFTIGVIILNELHNIFMYLVAAWMFGTAIYVLINRIRRLRGQRKFDRSMREDLQHALATATYQVRLSRIMRLNIVPIALLSVLSVWQSGKSIWQTGGILVFFILSYWASGWENNIYIKKKKELELLQEKLRENDAS